MSYNSYNFSDCPSALCPSEGDCGEMSLDELTTAITKMGANNRNLALENDVFQNFLNRANPRILADVGDEVKKLELRDRQSRLKNVPMDSAVSSINMLSKWKRRTEDATNRMSANSGSFRPPGRTLTNQLNTTCLSTVRACATSLSVRANISVKCDLLEKEIEEKRKSVKEFRGRGKTKQAILNARLEKMELAVGDVRKERESYERNVVATGRENITRRITAEKFVSFMENSLRKSDIELSRLKLKTNNRRKYYVIVKRTLEQRTELAEDIGILDMVILQNAYQTNSDKLVTKMHEIMTLKLPLGPLERNMLYHKELLMQQKAKLQECVDLIVRRRSSLTSTELDIKRTNAEIVKVKEHLAELREHVKAHVPIDEMRYLRVKIEIPRLRKEIKNWTRRREVQLANIKFSSRQLKVLEKHCIYLVEEKC